MALQVNDFVESVSALVLDGYDREYRVKDGQLVDLALNSTLAPKSIMVDVSLKFDSGIDAGDASHIFAITDRNQQKGSVDRRVRCLRRTPQTRLRPTPRGFPD